MFRWNAQVKLGRMTLGLSGDANHETDVFKAMTVWSEILPDKCKECGSDDLGLRHRKAQNYDFYSVRCNKCRAELRMGQTKEGLHLYPKEWEKFQPGGRGAQEQGPKENF
jgi:hypothetical protein